MPMSKSAYEQALKRSLTDEEYRKLTASVSTGAMDRTGAPMAPVAAKPAPVVVSPVTPLAPAEEQAFKGWVQSKHVPFDPGPSADYDMRGFWKALQAKDPRAVTAVNAGDGEMHFPDTWKTPAHATFSNESIYAPPDAPHWEGDLLIDKNGVVLADETPPGQPSKAVKRR